MKTTLKRMLSAFLAGIMTASAMAFPTTAVNEEIVSYTQEVDVLYMSTQPTFDGIINAYEWGEKSFTVSGADAAKPGDTAPSAANTFAWYKHEYDEISKEIDWVDEANKAKILGLTYDVWLRWDTKYLYIAAKVNDPDGYYLPAGRENIWNGDCVQFRVDPQGPNGYQKYKNPDYDYTTEAFDAEAASGIGYMPWAYSTKICNIGLGLVNGDASNSKNMQCYDMAEQGTGNMTKPQLLNDPKKLGPNVNPLKDENDYASLFSMKTCDQNGDGTNTYECAVPWAFLDQWGMGQVAVGYAWGMSLVVLNGYDDGDSTTSPYTSYLTWGSGICRAQQDDSYLRSTCGGSNAIILSDIDALTGHRIEGLPQKMEYDTDDGKVVNNIIDATGMDAYYLPGATSIVDGDFVFSMDVAYLGTDPINPDRTYIGSWIGSDYSMAAGWDASTKKFFVAGQHFDNGINKDIPYSQSEEEFDWQIGDWHNLEIKVVDDTVTISLDGKVYLVDTDKRNVCTSTSTSYEQITYNIGDYVYDNYSLTTGGKTVSYTLDTDDVPFSTSDFKLRAIAMAHFFIEGKCKNADPESKYGCLFQKTVDSEGKSALKCQFCGVCGHANVSVLNSVDPTCYTDGYTGDIYCLDCERIIEYGEPIPCGHSIIQYAAKAPTCTEVGWYAYEICLLCDYTTYEEIREYGHSIVSHDGKAASCTESGWKAYETCSVCNYTTYEEVPPTGHVNTTVINHSDSTCTTDGYTGDIYCMGCNTTIGYGETIPAGHSIIQHAAKAPTCTEVGWFAYEACENCDYTTYAELREYGHRIVYHEGKAPTCTETGWNGYENCSVCDYTTYEEIPATGHINLSVINGYDATCTVDGYKGDTYCNDCNTIIGYGELIPAEHFIIQHAAKAPTCTEVGWFAYEACENCDYTTYAELREYGHRIVNHEGKAPTCTEAGWNDYETCLVCDYTTYEEIPATGVHTGGTATCALKAICEVCHGEYGGVDADNHGETEIRGAVEPTQISDGYTGDTYCKDCETKLADGEVIPKLTTPGDATGDGNVNLADVSLILKCIAKWSVELDTDASDVTGDGNVNLADVSLILKYIAKWEVVLK